MFFDLVNGLMMGSSYSLMALGLSLIWSITEIPDFAQGGIYVLAAYVGYFVSVSAGQPFYIALLAAVATGATLAFLIEKLLYSRWRGNVFIQLLVAIALFFFLSNLANTLWTAKSKILPEYLPGKVTLLGWGISFQRIMVFVAACTLFTLIYFFIEKTKIGKGIRAASQDKEAAQIVGINIDTVLSAVFAIAGTLSATAAMLIAPIYAVYPAMGNLPLLKSLVVVVLAGFGNVGGVLVAGLGLGLVESFGSTYISSAYQHGFAFLLLILTLAFRPQGLFGRKSE